MTFTLCCAYLRVYQPMAAFPAAERRSIDAALSSHGGPAFSGRHALGLIAPEECREVYERVLDGELYVCPGQTRLRSLLGLIAFEQSLPEGVARVFFSVQEVAAARRELEAIRSESPEMRPCIVQSRWHVPIRWFVCFDDSERRIEQFGDHPRLRYDTTMAEAKARVGKALETLKGGIVHPAIVGMVFELREWLGTFHEHSLVELDYASVSRLFDGDELADDHSASDVWASIQAIGEGDGLRAGLYYQRANERWAEPRMRESLN